MTSFCTFFVGTSFPDNCLATNNGGTSRVGNRCIHSIADSRRVVPIDISNDLPAIGFKAFDCVIGKPAVHLAVDRNTVVVINHGEFAKAQSTG